jgi:oligoribonuclease
MSHHRYKMDLLPFTKINWRHPEVAHPEINWRNPENQSRIDWRLGKSYYDISRNKILKSYEKNNSEDVLIWLDLETTGLNLIMDKILEVVVVCTNMRGEAITIDGIVVPGFNYPFLKVIFKRDYSVFNFMEPLVEEFHLKNGLLYECLHSESALSSKLAFEKIFNYIKKFAKPKQCYLAGNSVYVDRNFLQRDAPEIINYMSHRLMDVSSLQLFAKSWFGSFKNYPKNNNHRAYEDIMESILQYRHISNFFINL